MNVGLTVGLEDMSASPVFHLLTPPVYRKGGTISLGLKFYFRKATRLTSSGYVRNDNWSKTHESDQSLPKDILIE